jgi:hypothetical protein
MKPMRGLKDRGSMLLLVLGLALHGCRDVRSVTEPEPPPVPGEEGGLLPRGVYEFRVTGLGTPEGTYSSVTRVTPPPELGAGAAASVVGPVGGLSFELASVSSFIHGERGQDGHRYVALTYRVRSDGAPMTNAALVPVTGTGTIAGTPWLTLKRFDGSDADAALAERIVPTGAVTLGEDLALRAIRPDVLQVFEEAEITALTVGGVISGFFPYGFMIRSAEGNFGRTVRQAADADDYAGSVTLAYRFPLGAANADDPFGFTFRMAVVVDGTTRLTESIEEGADTAAVRRLRERAAAIGATETTVLAGSRVVALDVTNYPGQRQICTVRTAGPAGSPVTTITAPGPYGRLLLLAPGESLDPCAPEFRGGVRGRPATGVQFPVQVVAVDIYGNLKTGVTETVRLEQQVGGPPATFGAATALVAGSATLNVTYADYGLSRLKATARRNQGARDTPVMGVVRTWTAGAETTAWQTGANWSPAAPPMSQDSVLIPAGPAHMPVLAQHVTVRRIEVQNTATISIGPFNLTAQSDVITGLSGGIQGSTGLLVLAGSPSSVAGRLPRTRVTGRYTLIGNTTVQAPFQSYGGLLRTSSFRLRVDN